MFAAAGTLLNTSKMAQNQGKVRTSSSYPRAAWTTYHSGLVQHVRYNIDAWDQMMMERDRRLTGHTRGQTVRAQFSLVPSEGKNNPDGHLVRSNTPRGFRDIQCLVYPRIHYVVIEILWEYEQFPFDVLSKRASCHTSRRLLSLTTVSQAPFHPIFHSLEQTHTTYYIRNQRC